VGEKKVIIIRVSRDSPSRIEVKALSPGFEVRVEKVSR